MCFRRGVVSVCIKAMCSLSRLCVSVWFLVPFDFSLFSQTAKKFFPISFLGSISWIAIFSYLMVWWAHQVCSHFISSFIYASKVSKQSRRAIDVFLRKTIIILSFVEIFHVYLLHVSCSLQYGRTLIQCRFDCNSKCFESGCGLSMMSCLCRWEKPLVLQRRLWGSPY